MVGLGRTSSDHIPSGSDDQRLADFSELNLILSQALRSQAQIKSRDFGGDSREAMMSKACRSMLILREETKLVRRLSLFDKGSMRQQSSS